MTSKAHMGSKSQRHSASETIGFLVHETGWTIDYICGLSLPVIRGLVAELQHRKACDEYRRSADFAMVLCSYANSNSRNRKYTVVDFIGEAPQREANMGIPKQKDLLVTLANGQEYKLRPLDLNMMETIEEQFKEGLGALLQSGRMAVYKAVLYEMLHDNYAELTKDRVGQLVTMAVLGPVSDVINGQMSNG